MNYEDNLVAVPVDEVLGTEMVNSNEILWLDKIMTRGNRQFLYKGIMIDFESIIKCKCTHYLIEEGN